MKRYDFCECEIIETDGGDYVRFDDLPGWVSVDDRLPECGVHVLIHEASQLVFIALYEPSVGWRWPWLMDAMPHPPPRPTHWMPLPEAPK